MKPPTVNRYVCSVSGLSQEAVPDEVLAIVPVEDPLEDLPLGWSRVTVETRLENPRYMLFLKARQTLIDQGLAATSDNFAEGEELTEETQALVEMLVDGQLSAMAVPPFAVLTEELFVHPQYLGHLMDTLGVDAEEESESEVVEAETPPNGAGAAVPAES